MEKILNSKGRLSEYPDHALMKRNKITKLKESGGKCEACNEEAFCIHHLDESKDNHEMDNLAILCRKCHGILHADTTYIKNNDKTSKYIREYGMSLVDMANKYGGDKGSYANMHKRGILHQELKKIEENIKKV